MQSKKNILMVVNPISGDLDKLEFVEAATLYCKNKKFELKIFYTTEKDDRKEIRRLYEENKPERVIIVGGDGTIKLVADALQNSDVIFGILPAGSANGLTVDLNFSKILSENILVAFENDFIQIDMVCINGHKSLHLSDLGLNAELIKNYENSKIRGKIGYILQSITTLSGEELPFNAVIKTAEDTFEVNSKMIVIANSKKYGTGVVINPLGLLNDGKFEIVVLKNLNLILFSKIVMGNMPLDSDEDVMIISTSSATITTDVPIHFQIDGEYYGMTKSLEIEILEKNFKVAVPTAEV
ncbi:MAG: diacylglycerol/lipid kinase family protein [Flavobacterium sp.]